MNKTAIATIAVLVAITGCSTKALPVNLEKYCVSDSGLSRYWLTLKTTERRGEIRYQYMGQDVRYAIKTMRIDGRMVTGRADFQSSSTGETRGTPIYFTYNGAADALMDGAASAPCQNLQTNKQN